MQADKKTAYLGFMSPLIPEFVEQVNVTKRVENSAHEPGLSNGFLHRVKTRTNHCFGAHNSRDRTSHFTQEVIGTCDCLLPRSYGIGDLLRLFETRVDDGDRNHPDAMLDAGGEHGDFWKESLVRGACHYLVSVPFRTGVWPHNGNGRAEVFDKMPTSASDGEDVCVRSNIPENFEGSMVLEKEIHLNADAANILEHVGKLHILRIGSKAIKSVGY